jgi:hypothetical protein
VLAKMRQDFRKSDRNNPSDAIPALDASRCIVVSAVTASRGSRRTSFSPGRREIKWLVVCFSLWWRNPVILTNEEPDSDFRTQHSSGTSREEDHSYD